MGFFKRSKCKIIVHPGDRGKWWWRVVDKAGKTRFVPVGHGYDDAYGAERAALHTLDLVGADKLPVTIERQ